MEEGETPLDAAKRALYEKSGAVEFTIKPIFDYRSGHDKAYAGGQVFFAEIEKLGPIPEGSEMRDVGFFDYLPRPLTYRDITTVLIETANKLKITNFKIQK